MIARKVTHYSDMKYLFQREAVSAKIEDPVIYSVEEYEEVDDMKSAITRLYPGTIGGEFYMTRGHQHERFFGETYTFLHGHGILYMISLRGETDIRVVAAGDCINVPPGFAHRVINTGSDELIFLATYATSAGHDYKVDFPLHFGGVPNE